METILVQFLAPFLPHLLKGVKESTEEAAEKLGENAWRYAKAIWAKLRPKVDEKPAAAEAAADVADHPDDEDARAAMRLQVKKLLSEDPTLEQQLQSLLDQARADGVVASGDNSVAIGGSVTADRGGVAAGRDISGGVHTSQPPSSAPD